METKTLIEEYEHKIERLSIDRAFGILTRPALEEAVKDIKKPFNVIFIDFNKVKELNEKIGYDHVNLIFRKLFKSFYFRKIDLVGRWFSGDEIVILTRKDVWGLLHRFVKHAEGLNLSFKFKVFEKIKSFEEMVFTEVN